MRPDWRDLPAASRLAPDHPRRAEVLERHGRALASGLSTYLDPQSGFSVMTAQYLADRGYCCSAGCRHCPWVDGWDQFAD
jgi:hypothetical protein